MVINICWLRSSCPCGSSERMDSCDSLFKSSRVLGSIVRYDNICSLPFLIRSQWHPQCVPTCESVTRHLDNGNVLRGDGG